LLIADDITLMLLRASGLQFLLNEVDQYSNKWRFTFSPSKSKIIIFCLWKHHVNLLLQGFRKPGSSSDVISTDDDPSRLTDRKLCMQ
jgi:hypothetical protein